MFGHGQDYCREKGGKVYRSKHFLQGRAKAKAYKVFYGRFVPCIVGKRAFNRRIETEVEGVELCSPSDEALALIALENGEEHWIDLFTKSNGEIRPLRKGETRPKEWESTICKKWTSRRDDKGNTTESKDLQWSAEAIQRFNQIRALVVQDRKKHPEFAGNWVRYFKKKRREQAAGEKDTKTRPSKVRMVEAHDDLFTANEDVEAIVTPTNTGHNEDHQATETDLDSQEDEETELQAFQNQVAV